MCTSPATTPPASPTSDSPHDRNNQKCHTLQEDAPTRSVSCIPCLTGEFAAFRFFLRCHQPGSLVALVAESAAGLLQDIRGPGLLECPRVMRLPGRTGLARSSRISGSNTGMLGRCKPALAVACSSRPRSASFPGGYSVNGADRRDVP